MGRMHTNGLAPAGVVLAVGLGLLVPATAATAQTTAAGDFERGSCRVKPTEVTINGSEGGFPGAMNFSVTCFDLQPKMNYTFPAMPTTGSAHQAACTAAGPGTGTAALESDQFGFVSQFYSGGKCTPGRFTLTITPATGRPVTARGILVASSRRDERDGDSW